MLKRIRKRKFKYPCFDSHTVAITRHCLPILPLLFPFSAFNAVLKCETTCGNVLQLSNTAADASSRRMYRHFMATELLELSHRYFSFPLFSKSPLYLRSIPLM